MSLDSELQCYGLCLSRRRSILCSSLSLACGLGRLSSVERLLALSSFFLLLLLAPMDWAKCAENIGSPQNIGMIQKRRLIVALRVYTHTLFLIVFALFYSCVSYRIISANACAPPRWMLNPVSPGSQPCRWVSHLSVVQAVAPSVPADSNKCPAGEAKAEHFTCCSRWPDSIRQKYILEWKK